MAIFTVTRGADASREDDAFITLREAIEAAAANEGPDTIQFADGVRTVSLIGAEPSSGATIFNGFTIGAGEDLLLDGNTDGDGVGEVAISGSFATAHFIVEEGASLTLRGLDLIEGVNEQTEAPGRAAPGEATDAALFDPAAQGDDGADARDAFGAILNLGDLRLE